MNRTFYLQLVLLLALVLSACSPPSKVAVVERKTVDPRLASEKIGGAYIRIAEPGDSLHGIAFANGLNVNKLAAWNDLTDTSRLLIGQRIRLTQPIGFSSKKASKKVSRKPRAPSSQQQTRAKRSETKLVRKPAARSVVKQTQATSPAFTSKVIWTWPTKGRVVANFAPSAGRQGIDISGENGQAVLASSSGEVVYVGNGLKGYGNLVIVKHNEEYLSAYAHNKETFVREGQRINTGYRIASLGKNKLKSNVLHFQIRQHGKPVDPKKYLPND